MCTQEMENTLMGFQDLTHLLSVLSISIIIGFIGTLLRNCTASGWTDLLVPHEDACTYTFNETLHFVGEVGGILPCKCEIQFLLSMLNLRVTVYSTETSFLLNCVALKVLECHHVFHLVSRFLLVFYLR